MRILSGITLQELSLALFPDVTQSVSAGGELCWAGRLEKVECVAFCSHGSIMPSDSDPIQPDVMVRQSFVYIFTLTERFWPII